jgi:hypothetical protein
VQRYAISFEGGASREGVGHSGFVLSVFQFSGIFSLFLSGYILGCYLLCFSPLKTKPICFI